MYNIRDGGLLFLAMCLPKSVCCHEFIDFLQSVLPTTSLPRVCWLQGIDFMFVWESKSDSAIQSQLFV